MTKEIKTVRHHDGSTTTWARVHLTLAEIARRFAIWTRLVPVGTPDARGIEFELVREPRGRMRDCYGRQAFTTRLRVRANGREAVATKTRLGEYFGAYIETLDENGAEFWDNQDKPNRWILADVFAI